MGRKIKVFLSCLITIVCIGLSSTVAMAKEPETLEDSIAIQEIIREKGAFYLSQPDIKEEADELGLSVDELIYQKAVATYQVRNAIGKMVNKKVDESRGLGNNGQILYANVPLIMQPNNYTCGPTSVLQVLYALNCAGNVAGTTNADKINTLAVACNTTSAGSHFANVTKAVNQYSPTMKYEAITGSTMTVSQFQGKVETSLLYNAAPILHAKTATLPYYNGHQSGHFIAVCELDRTTGKIKVRDCNNNSSYYGEHQETIAHVFSAINHTDRHLICLAY